MQACAASWYSSTIQRPTTEYGRILVHVHDKQHTSTGKRESNVKSSSSRSFVVFAVHSKGKTFAKGTTTTTTIKINDDCWKTYLSFWPSCSSLLRHPYPTSYKNIWQFIQLTRPKEIFGRSFVRLASMIVVCLMPVYGMDGGHEFETGNECLPSATAAAEEHTIVIFMYAKGITES